MADNMTWKRVLANLSRGFQNASGLVVKRGSAMGPLIPVLSLSPIFLLFAWLLRANVVFSGPLVVAAIWIAIEYISQANQARPGAYQVAAQGSIAGRTVDIRAGSCEVARDDCIRQCERAAVIGAAAEQC